MGPPRVLVLALVLSAMVVGSAVFAVVAQDDDSDVADTQQSYEPWQSAQLFTFPGEWDAIPTTTVRNTYPLQTSLQRMLRPAHPGSESTAAGTSCAACHGNPVVGQSSVSGWEGPPTDHFESGGCVACHGGLERSAGDLGTSLVNREFAGEIGPGYKPGYIDVDVKAAYDDEYFYIRLEWASERPGVTHDLFRFDGEEWGRWSAAKPDADRDEDQLASFEDRIAFNLADGEIPAFDGATANFGSIGCYIGCHDSQVNMPNEVSGDDVDTHPYLGVDGIDAEEITKYLLNSRNVDESDEPGAWDAVKSEDELEALFHSGQFLDMWMWRGSRGGALGYADDIYIFDSRHGDDGTSMFYSQSPPFDFMFDESVTGFNAIPGDRFEEFVGDFPLVPGVNAVEFDPDIEFQEGDIIPRRVLRDPDGSRADILANSWWEDGRWVVVMRRALDTGNPDDHVLEPRRTYFLGLAVFDDHVGNRYHHVSFPVTIGLGVEADIIAISLTEGE
jgi:hypothetical protein